MLLGGTCSCSRWQRVGLHTHTHTPSQPNQQRVGMSRQDSPSGGCNRGVGPMARPAAHTVGRNSVSHRDTLLAVFARVNG